MTIAPIANGDAFYAVQRAKNRAHGESFAIARTRIEALTKCLARATAKK